MKKLFGFLLIVTFVMSSCIKSDDVSIKGLEQVSVRSLSNLDITLGVENRSGRNINLEGAKIHIDNKNEPLLSMVVRDKVVIPKRSTSSVTMNIALKFNNPLGIISLVSTLKRSMANLTVSGEIVVKAGWTRKKIELKSVPLSQILATFGMKTEDIIKSIEI